MSDSSFRLSIKNQIGNITYMSMKPDSALKKALQIYAKENNMQYNTIIFLIDGERFSHHKTPNQLGLEDDVEITAMVEQTGGAGYGGSQRDRDRERASARTGAKGKGKDDGLTPEQRRERDGKALQEKTAKKAAGAAAAPPPSGSGGSAKK